MSTKTKYFVVKQYTNRVRAPHRTVHVGVDEKEAAKIREDFENRLGGEFTLTTVER